MIKEVHKGKGKGKGKGAWQKRGLCTFCRLLALPRLRFPTLHSLN